MKQRRSRSEDVLFISALAAVLAGIGLLLNTTEAVPVGDRLWPVLVMAVGGMLGYFALVRGASDYFFFGGILFVLTGTLSIVSNLVGWTLRQAWPLVMVASGATGLFTGLRHWRRMRPGFMTTSICFLFLGTVFSLFSFEIHRHQLQALRGPVVAESPHRRRARPVRSLRLRQTCGDRTPRAGRRRG